MIDKEEKESKEKFEVRLDVGKGEVKDDFKIFDSLYVMCKTWCSQGFDPISLLSPWTQQMKMESQRTPRIWGWRVG